MVGNNAVQDTVYENAKAFSMERVVPNFDALTENGSMRKVIAHAKEAGLCGIGLPKDLGGVGYGYRESALVYEGLAYGDPIYAFMLQLHNNITLLINRLDSNHAHREIVEAMIRGEKTNAFAFTEGGSGSDPMSTTGYAEEMPDGYRVTAKKEWIGNGEDADHFVLIVKNKDAKGMVMLLGDRTGQGLTYSDRQKMVIGNSIAPAAMNFDSFFVPKADLLSARGFSEALVAIDVARIFVPAMCIGLSRRALDMTEEFLANRSSFGKHILQNETIQWRLAELEAKLTAARLLLHETADMMDRGEAISTVAAKNKLLAPQLAAEITGQCMHYLGAQGFLANNTALRLLLAAKLFGTVDGTIEIQRMVIGREIARRYG